MKSIKTKRGVKILVDDEDFKRVSSMTWCVSPKLGYAFSRTGKFRRGGIYMHRFLMNAPSGRSVDHADGNKLNNQKSNLRVCSHSENLKNQKLRINNSSGFKGIHFISKSKRWRAQIKVNYKVRHLGCFGSRDEARRAYDKAADIFHGDFACTNKMLGLL